MPKEVVTRESGFTYAETYALYNEQLHYARSTYTVEQLDRWQADWNRYFARFGMEIPSYAHKAGGSSGSANKIPERPANDNPLAA